MQGAEHRETAQAIRDGDFERMPISDAERVLLGLIEILTHTPWQITDAHVAAVRDAGWSDAQIAEAVYVGAFFALCVRLADAFGIRPPAFMDRDGAPRVLRGE